jgi:hypothetical protein
MWEFIVSQSEWMFAGIVFFNELIGFFEISYPLYVLKRFKFYLFEWKRNENKYYFYAWASSASLLNLRPWLPLWLFHLLFEELGALLTATTNKAIRITIEFNDIFLYFSLECFSNLNFEFYLFIFKFRKN